MDITRRKQKLIELLWDSTARWDERDDAAIDLGQIGDLQTIQSLVRFCGDSTQDEGLLGSCGEAIAHIAIRINVFDTRWYEHLPAIARQELTALFRGVEKLEWLPVEDGGAPSHNLT